ncbi:12245_t:CDS:10 [Ambispora leptoticha]|uniref:12245_t:CDS:1 n=1 Tax=Ambispora leptoticha TaxID=144679 RepID=A0A9N8VSN1_9GLOM|nr:12245_t:CDS:10 [Ambispora leptoticha]
MKIFMGLSLLTAAYSLYRSPPIAPTLLPSIVAIEVKFLVKLLGTDKYTQYYGNNSGTYLDDLDKVATTLNISKDKCAETITNIKVKKIVLKGGDVIDSVQFTYLVETKDKKIDVEGHRHGGATMVKRLEFHSCYINSNYSVWTGARGTQDGTEFSISVPACFFSKIGWSLNCLGAYNGEVYDADLQKAQTDLVKLQTDKSRLEKDVAQSGNSKMFLLLQRNKNIQQLKEELKDKVLLTASKKELLEKWKQYPQSILFYQSQHKGEYSVLFINRERQKAVLYVFVNGDDWRNTTAQEINNFLNPIGLKVAYLLGWGNTNPNNDIEISGYSAMGLIEILLNKIKKGEQYNMGDDKKDQGANNYVEDIVNELLSLKNDLTNKGTIIKVLTQSFPEIFDKDGNLDNIKLQELKNRPSQTDYQNASDRIKRLQTELNNARAELVTLQEIDKNETRNLVELREKYGKATAATTDKENLLISDAAKAHYAVFFKENLVKNFADTNDNYVWILPSPAKSGNQDYEAAEKSDNADFDENVLKIISREKSKWDQLGYTDKSELVKNPRKLKEQVDKGLNKIDATLISRFLAAAKKEGISVPDKLQKNDFKIFREIYGQKLKRPVSEGITPKAEDYYTGEEKLSLVIQLFKPVKILGKLSSHQSTSFPELETRYKNQKDAILTDPFFVSYKTKGDTEKMEMLKSIFLMYSDREMVNCGNSISDEAPQLQAEEDQDAFKELVNDNFGDDFGKNLDEKSLGDVKVKLGELLEIKRREIKRDLSLFRQKVELTPVDINEEFDKKIFGDNFDYEKAIDKRLTLNNEKKGSEKPGSKALAILKGIEENWRKVEANPPVDWLVFIERFTLEKNIIEKVGAEAEAKLKKMFSVEDSDKNFDLKDLDTLREEMFTDLYDSWSNVFEKTELDNLSKKINANLAKWDKLIAEKEETVAADLKNAKEKYQKEDFDGNIWNLTNQEKSRIDRASDKQSLEKVKISSKTKLGELPSEEAIDDLTEYAMALMFYEGTKEDNKQGFGKTVAKEMLPEIKTAIAKDTLKGYQDLDKK